MWPCQEMSGHFPPHLVREHNEAIRRGPSASRSSARVLVLLADRADWPTIRLGLAILGNNRRMSPMRTLVTGGAGFIGSHLVARLLQRGDDVVILDSLEDQVHKGTKPLLPADVELIVGDVADHALADRALGKWTASCTLPPSWVWGSRCTRSIATSG